MPLLTAAQLVANAAARLSDFPNPRLDAEMLFRGVSGLDRAALMARGQEPVEAALAAKFEAALARRERHEPIQYILGVASFWRDEFIVTPAVLIPRPDTEILVEAVVERLRSGPSPTVLDIGTGSGCIALSILRDLQDARALAADVSEEALEIARRNADRLDLASRIELRASSWLGAIAPGERFAAIVSNPPYVSRADRRGLPEEVREHEPALALFADSEDGLSSYRAILEGLDGHLEPSGLVAFEVGLGQAPRVAGLMRDAAFTSLEVLNDLAGIARVVLGRR
jgi:release factor glutamine methyltransferase